MCPPSAGGAGGSDAPGLQRGEPRQAILGGHTEQPPCRGSSELVKGRHLTVSQARKFTSLVHMGCGRMFLLLRCDQLDDLGKERETVKSAHRLLFFLLLTLHHRHKIWIWETASGFEMGFCAVVCEALSAQSRLMLQMHIKISHSVPSNRNQLPLILSRQEDFSKAFWASVELGPERHGFPGPLPLSCSLISASLDLQI